MAKNYWPLEEEGRTWEEVVAQVPILDIDAFHSHCGEDDEQLFKFNIVLGVKNDVPIVLIQDVSNSEIVDLGILQCHRPVTDDVFSPVLDFIFANTENVAIQYDRKGWKITPSGEDCMREVTIPGGVCKIDGVDILLNITNFAANEVDLIDL